MPFLFADMNANKLAFTVNDGDLKAGGGACLDSIYQQAYDWMNSLEAPAAFTPGDNDWTDCDRPNLVPSLNSLERLEFERKLFFSTPYTLGKRKMRQTVQATPLCKGYSVAAVPCVENRRWMTGRVVYVTVSVQGSCNNLCDAAPDAQEFAMRNAAGIQWIKDAFSEAKTKNAVAIMIISQANPGFDKSDTTRAPSRDPKTLAEANAATDGFVDFLKVVRAETIAFRKPVAYVHGDSHYFRVDKPLLSETDGARIENFTRVETFGNNAIGNSTSDVTWLKVLVDPKSREVFSYQPQSVPANRTTVPVQ
jgi:hypothetical protein